MSNSRLIFVFGSNLAGRHGKGAALEALQSWGARRGVGIGPAGSSYAIPTKDANLHPLTLKTIEGHVRDFLVYARRNSSDTFKVTRIGCGLAGYQDHHIAPFFLGAPPNCLLPPEWLSFYSKTLGANPWTTNPHPTPGPSVSPSCASSSSSS